MSFLRRKFWQPLVDLLRQGLSPDGLALSVAVGLVIAVMPVLGVTTGLCALAALVFRLNLVASQLANYAAYPLQFLLLIPFFRAGAWLFREDPGSWTTATVLELVRSDPWGAATRLWTLSWHALVVWLLLAGPLIWVLKRLLVPAFKKISAKNQSRT